MSTLLTIVWAIGVLTWFAEIGSGIAVTGWQGEKPYVVRNEQPSLYWSLIGFHLVILAAIPLIQILTR